MPCPLVEPIPTKHMDFLDDVSGDTPSVVTRIPGLIAQRGTAFGDFLNNFSRFLLDPVRVRAGLRAINAAMWNKAQLNRALAPMANLTEDSLAIALADRNDNRGGLAPIARRLLSVVLTDIENAHGFDVPAPRHRAVTLSDLVDNDMFRDELISPSRTWKDPSVPTSHGEFTHRLQWCAAMLEMGAGVDWFTFYGQCGGWADDDLLRGGRFGLWDALVDRNIQGSKGSPTPYDSRGADDLRSPENMQAWLLVQANREPRSDIRLLASFIHGRNEKRKQEDRDDVPYIPLSTPTNGAVVPLPLGTFRQNTWDKWSRMLFQGRHTIQLSAAEKGVLARAWYRLIELTFGDRLRYPIIEVRAADVAIPAVAPPTDLSAAYVSLGLDANGN